MHNAPAHIPVINISALVAGTEDSAQVAAQIRQACLDSGFFFVTGHGVDGALQTRLLEASRQFFAQDLATKQELSLEQGGRAWRGYFTAEGVLKEGLNFGAVLDAEHPLVQAGVPFFGPNLFPARLPQLRDAVLEYMAVMTGLGHIIMRGIAQSLGLEASYFVDRYTADPLVQFRIFHYPPAPSPGDDHWGVREHTDYGLLTMLLQDDVGGLEVKVGSRWIPATPVPGSFVCNIGDMLDRMTGGLYRSTPHRVRSHARSGRYSFPFFFGPNYYAQVRPIELPGSPNYASVQAFQTFPGTYGEYLLSKVLKVYPKLREMIP